jgi:hypothetical protein
VVLFQYGMCTTGSPSAHALANVASSSAAKITYPPTLPLSQEASPRTSAAGGRSPQRQAPSPRNDTGSLRNVLGSGANTAGCAACDGCSPCVVANMAENSSSMLPYETSTTVYLSQPRGQPTVCRAAGRRRCRTLDSSVQRSLSPECCGPNRLFMRPPRPLSRARRYCKRVRACVRACAMGVRTPLLCDLR